MGKKYFVVALFFIVMLGFIVFICGAPVFWYLDWATFTVTVVLSFILMFFNYSGSEVVRFFSCALGSASCDPSVLKKGMVFFDTLRHYLMITAVIATLMGFMAMLGSGFEDMQAFGKGSAQAVISLLYALIFTVLICLPFKTALKKKLIDTE